MFCYLYGMKRNAKPWGRTSKSLLPWSRSSAADMTLLNARSREENQRKRRQKNVSRDVTRVSGLPFIFRDCLHHIGLIALRT